MDTALPTALVRGSLAGLLVEAMLYGKKQLLYYYIQDWK